VPRLRWPILPVFFPARGSRSMYLPGLRSRVAKGPPHPRPGADALPAWSTPATGPSRHLGMSNPTTEAGSPGVIVLFAAASSLVAIRMFNARR